MMFDIEIIGTGRYVPENKVTNHDLAALVDTSDEWITQRTGIKERRISLGEDTTEMAVQASLKALEDAGYRPEEIDLIILATVTPTYYFPSAACLVQARLGAGQATSFDISAGCTGFIYALNIAAQFIKCGTYKTALVVGAEVLSKITDWSDRKTCVLFADGAGAAVLQRGKAGIIASFTGADGRGADYLYCHGVPFGNQLVPVKDTQPHYTVMNGREVFKFAVNIMPESILKVLEGSGFTLDDIKYFLPHQANIRIIEAAAKKLKVDKDRFYINIDRYGNTSSASIPIALDEMSRNGQLLPGDLIVVTGFGAGLTYGAHLIKWTKANY